MGKANFTDEFKLDAIKQITERGLGNGISLIICAGIMAGLPHAIGGTLELTRTGAFSIPLVLLLFVLVIAVTAFVMNAKQKARAINAKNIQSPR